MVLSKLYHIDGLLRAVGWTAGISVLIRRALGMGQAIKVRCRDHDLIVRPTDSDLFVIAQVFGHGEYEIGKRGVDALNQVAAQWREEGFVPVVVDAGANVGYSSIFLRDQYPDAVVLAIEPDREAFEALQLNCAGLDRITPVHGALWSHDGEVGLINSDAPSWAHAVSEGRGVRSVTLESLLTQLHKAKLLMLKMDIEGAELEASRDSKILKEVPCILVEPHDFMFPGRGCLTHIYTWLAKSGRSIDSLINGENLILLRSDIFQVPSGNMRSTAK